jgi:hypothetical protein
MRSRQNDPMADAAVPTAATLSALTDHVDDLLRRVGAGALAADRSPTEPLAAALFDAERALRSARRALQRAERTYG